MPLEPARRDESAAWLRLILTPGIGPATTRELLEAFGLPEDICSASLSRLSRVVDTRTAQALRGDDEARDAAIERCLDWAQGPGRHLVALGDADYPAALLSLSDPPPLLFVRGDPARLNRPTIAIVGSRQASRAGADHAEQFARALADAGLAVVSGLAVGIDAAAHRGGLAGAAGTVAVIGSGQDVIYPTQHRPLADRIAATGAVVSEFALGEPPVRANFPRRNRLIAALGAAVLVIEAARQSGSLITARLAGELGREVMAIPGSIDSPLARGCHALIKQGAKLIESAQDVLDELPDAVKAAAQRHARPDAAAAPDRGRHGERGDRRPSRSLGGARPPDRRAQPPDGPRQVLDALGWDPASIDELAAHGGWPASDVSAHLSVLELGGWVERSDDGRFRRIGRA